MSKGIILFQSKYGATTKYANWLQEATGFDLVETKRADINALQSCDTVVLGGGVYASGILGFSFLKKNIDRQWQILRLSAPESVLPRYGSTSIRRSPDIISSFLEDYRETNSSERLLWALGLCSNFLFCKINCFCCHRNGPDIVILSALIPYSAVFFYLIHCVFPFCTTCCSNPSASR